MIHLKDRLKEKLKWEIWQKTWKTKHEKTSKRDWKKTDISTLCFCNIVYNCGSAVGVYKMKTNKELREEIVEEFKDRYSRYFEHEEFGYEDLDVEEWLSKTIDQLLSYKFNR